MFSMIKSYLRPVLHKDLLLDLEDRVRAEALKAFEMIRDHSGLNRKRAREAEGQARFRMMEQGFEEVCGLHGGVALDGSVIPHTDLKVFQPFMRFEVNGQGIILGLAAMSVSGELPTKNKSRKAGVALNYDLMPRLDLGGIGPKIGDIFSLLLISRDREKGGQIEEIAVGVIDAEYETFLFYESLDKFLRGHGDAPIESPTPPTPFKPSVGVSLKKAPRPFVPPESLPEHEKDNGAETHN